MALSLRQRPHVVTGLTCAFLVVLTTVSHFGLARHFGFYEDDYAAAGATLDWTPGAVVQWVRFAFGRDGQGRPVGFLLGGFLPWIGYGLAGGRVIGMYAVAAAILSANAVLLFTLLRRAGFPSPVPLLAAMAMVLFPADTTHPFLCHATILQPSLTLLLVALHLYLGGRRPRPWSYVAIAAAVLCYETTVLPFLVAPLLVPGVWNRRLPGRLLRHVGIVVGILTVAFLVRRLGGEVRVADQIGTIQGLAHRVLFGCLIGPGVALRQCGARAVETFVHGDALTAALVAFVPLFAVVASVGRRMPMGNAGSTVGRLAGVGAVMTVLAYGLSFTHYPPDATFGRLTSVHMAAAPGVGLLLAAAAYGLLAIGRRVHLFYPAAAFVGLYLSLLVGFAWRVQDGFAREWQEQRTYWTEIVTLCPDAGPGTVVLLRGAYPPESDFILTKSWADYLVWRELFRFPPGRPPPILVDFDAWPTCLDWHAEDGTLRWARLPDRHYGPVDGQPLPANNVILIEARQDAGRYHLVRVGGTADVAGHPLAARPVPASEGRPAVPRGTMYGLLVGSPESEKRNPRE